MSFFRRLMTIDHRFIYLVLAATTLSPLLLPITFPVASEAPAVALYQYLAALPQGSPVLFSADFNDRSLSELRPMLRVLGDLSLKKGHRLLLIALWPGGCQLAAEWLEPVLLENEAVYGENYLVLGDVTAPLFLEEAKQDFLAACRGIDHSGIALDSYPIMADIALAGDIKAVISIGSADPGYTTWVRHWYAMGEVEAAFFATTEQDYLTYLNVYNAISFKGGAGGLGGAATLEEEHGLRGEAHRIMASQSLASLSILLFILLGNIGHIGARIRSNSGKGKMESGK